MSVQFQKPLVLLEWQARHQRGSRCARAGQVSGYYGVAMDTRGALDVPGQAMCQVTMELLATKRLISNMLFGTLIWSYGFMV